MAGETLIALPELALLWPAESTLFVADVHLGKDAAMLALGIPAPLGPTTETLARLTQLLETTQAKRLVLLGDLWHAKQGRTANFTADFVSWRRSHGAVDMLLVEGNHDLKSGPLPPDASVREVPAPHIMGPFALCHYPEPCAEGYVLSGHIHPSVLLLGKGRQSLAFPCFWFGDEVAVLPAFGAFTGCARISPSAGDQVLMVAEGRVMPAPR